LNFSRISRIFPTCFHCFLGTRLFGLADSVWPIRSGLSVWSIRSEPFRSGPFRSGDISVRLWNLAEILHVHILMQTYLNQRELLLKQTTNMI